MRRAKPGPTGPVASRSRLDTPASLEKQSTASSSSGASANILDQRRSSNTSSASQWSTTEYPTSVLPPEAIRHPNTAISTSLSLAGQLPSSFSTSSLAYRDYGVTDGAVSYPLNSNDYRTNVDLQDVMSFQTRRWQRSSRTPDSPHGSISDVEDEDDLESDREDVKQEMCIVPVPDPNTPQNTLPFILGSYARWVKLVVFEPSKGATPMKDNIVNRFMRLPEERPRIIMLANVIGSLGKSITPSPGATSLVAYLSTEAYWHLKKFILNKPPSDREVDRRKALDALDLVMEVILIQRYFHSLFTLVKFMEVVAPVFRRACPEPLDRYVNLPRAVMSHDVNIRNFATSDVILSATTGRPMLFRYDMTCPPDVLELINDGRYGMQWLHGVPDQYIITLAHINVLAEEIGFEATVSPHCVAEIENQIQQVEVCTERSADPVSIIWKYTVRECWRMAAYVYLYMVLCRASTDDPRVLASVKSYVRLLRAVKPGRKPDAFLYIPMIIVGASAYEKQDREVIRCRLFGLQECINSGSTGYDVMSILMDLWTRTEAEDRPAFWSDFRMSMFRVTGV